MSAPAKKPKSLEVQIRPIQIRLANAMEIANQRGHAYTCAVARIGIELAAIRQLHLSTKGAHEDGFKSWLKDNFEPCRKTAYNYINCAANVLRACGQDVTIDNLHTYSAADITKAEATTHGLSLSQMRLPIPDPDEELLDDDGEGSGPADDPDEDRARQLFLPLWTQARNLDHHIDDLHLLPIEELRTLAGDLKHASATANDILKQRARDARDAS